MEVDKQKFRALIKEGKIGMALNQLSDISHFLEQRQHQEKLENIGDRYQEMLDLPAGDPRKEELKLEVKTELLALLDELPESFTIGAGDQEGNSGCLGVVLLLMAALGYAFL